MKSLILTLISALERSGGVYDYLLFLGSPVIAVGLGLIYGILVLTRHLSKQESLDKMEEGIKQSGIILLVTGGGGALGNVLQESGAGDYIAEQIVDLSIPLILLPFIVSSLVRIAQGSGTVAMITAASITDPILTGLDVNLGLAAIADTSGSLVFSYFNDSFFWIVNRMLGIRNVKEQIITWSIPTTLAWLTALVGLLVANMFV